MKNLKTELIIPNQIELIYLVRKFIQEMADLCNFSEKKIMKLVLASDEAFTNIISHAFEKDEDGKISIIANITPLRLVLSFVDEGVPFSENLVPKYDPIIENQEIIDTKGLGLFLIRMNVDDLEWLNYGRNGKELRLIINREKEELDTFSNEDVEEEKIEVILAPEQNYTIRLLKDTECIRISQCIYKTYGYTYPNEDLYYPDRIKSLNSNGELISAVAVDEAGDIVGHYALERPGLGKAAESGQAVVEPEHRGRNLMTRMRTFLEEEACRIGIFGIFSQPITNHVLSQMVNEHFGSHVAGVTLALIPETLHIKKMKTTNSKRVTSMLYYKSVAKRSDVFIYAPLHHQEMIEQIYENLGLQYSLAKGKSYEGEGKTEVKFHSGWGFGTISVINSNSSTAVEVKRALNDLCNFAFSKVVYLELPLNDPRTPELCVESEKMGFFFSGIGPDFGNDFDTLRMQFLNCDVNFSEIQIVNDFGIKLFDYIMQERKRILGIEEHIDA